VILAFIIGIACSLGLNLSFFRVNVLN
jgi:hypothetical protein